MDLIDREAAITSLTFAEETGRMSCGELKGVIEVLNRLPSAQPTQPNTSNALESLDCIDRQAAIYALDSEIEITGRTNAEAVKGYVKLVKDRLERLPSAQPKRKKGKWIFIESIYKRDGWNADIYRCDQCNRKIQMRVVLKKGEDITDYKRYCECCGSLMEGVDDKRVSD